MTETDILTWTTSIISKSWIPWKVDSNLSSQVSSATHDFDLGLSIYIDGKFPTQPDQLSGISMQLRHIAWMSFLCMNSRRPQLVDSLEVFGKHIRVLVIFGGYVLLDGV